MRKLTFAQRVTLVKLYKLGYPVPDIAKHFNVTTGSVYYHFRKLKAEGEIQGVLGYQSIDDALASLDNA